MSRRPTEPGPVAQATGLSVLPAALIVYLAFNNGGYFPAATAWLAAGLGALLAVRVLLVRDALRGFEKPFWVVAGALALLALWTLASAAWSGAPARAVIESDRTLLYLLAFVYFASVGGSPRRLECIGRGLTGGILVVALSALAARLLPTLWPFAADLTPYGLEYPVGYPNALGLLVGFGLLLSVYIASSPGNPRSLRLMAVASVPALATTLLLTRSLGAAAVTIAALALFASLARPHAFSRTALALIPTSAVALLATLDAGVLATADASSPRALADGRMVAAVLALCSANAVLLYWLFGRRESRLRVRPRQRRPAAIVAGFAVLAVVVLLGAVVIDRSSERASTQGRQGAEGESRTAERAPAANSTGPSGIEARTLYWDVAARGFADTPMHGRGAGSYEFLWEKRRPVSLAVTDAHSWPLETLAELGVVGFALLVTGLATMLMTTGRAARGTDRAVYGVVFCVGVAWAAHGLIDWDWETPVVTVPFLALGGAVLGTRRPEPSPRSLPLRGSKGTRRAAVRAGLTAASLSLAGISGWLAFSQEHLDRAVAGYRAGDCTAAMRDARESLAVIDFRPEPHEVLGLCELRRGDGAAAQREMKAAAHREPANWEHQYGRALALSALRQDPRRALEAAKARNPRGRLVRSARRASLPSLAELERRRGPQPLD